LQVSFFNQNFSRIAADLTKGLKSQNSSSYVPPKIFDTIFVSETSYNEILNILGKLKNKYPFGLDEFRDCLLKTCAPALIQPLTHIFNASLSIGIFSDILKTAKLGHFIKKGNKNEFLNYTLISLLSVFSKTLERLFYTRMESFLRKTKRFQTLSMDLENPNRRKLPFSLFLFLFLLECFQIFRKLLTSLTITYCFQNYLHTEFVVLP